MTEKKYVPDPTKKLGEGLLACERIHARGDNPRDCVAELARLLPKHSTAELARWLPAWENYHYRGNPRIGATSRATKKSIGDQLSFPNPFDGIEKRLDSIEAQLSFLLQELGCKTAAAALFSADEYVAKYVRASLRTLQHVTIPVPQDQRYSKIHAAATKVCTQLFGDQACSISPHENNTAVVVFRTK